MPSKGRIQATDFQSLLLELGVNPNGIPFELRSEVTPVVLVGGTVSFVAAPTPAYRVTELFTAGTQTAPAGGTVLADTGPLLQRPVSLEFLATAAEDATHEIQWRNVANSANLRAIRIRILNQVTFKLSTRFNIENAGERIRWVNITVGGVGVDYDAMILAAI